MHSAMDPRSASCLLKDPLVEAADQLWWVKIWPSSIRRPSSRCGVLGCHPCCSTGLSSCHSFCPLPAGAHSTARYHSTCLGNWYPGCWLQSLDSAKGTVGQSPQWAQRLQMTHSMAWVYQFLWQPEHSKSKAVQLEGFPFASTPPKLFLRRLVHNGMIFSLLHLVGDIALHAPRECQFRNMWRVGSGILWTISLMIKRYA